MEPTKQKAKVSVDRRIEPKLQPVEEIYLPDLQLSVLDNSIPCYRVHREDQEALKIEFIFNAGRLYEPANQVAALTSQMLREGTASYKAEALEEAIDYFGCSLTTLPTNDTASVILYCLPKQLPDVLPIFEEVIKQPTFPEQEFNTLIRNRKQKLQVRRKKVDYVASNEFDKLLFGAKHPYGYFPDNEMFDALDVDQLKAYHQEAYNGSNCRILMSGYADDEALNHVNRYFGNIEFMEGGATKAYSDGFEPSNDLKYREDWDDAHQSAIRIGKVLFNKTHPDYPELMLLNAVLGGYFGSRLMSNIREDKGYTYGIYSHLSSYTKGGCFYISTEVGKPVAEASLEEIYKELRRIREEVIPVEEFELVKNYLLGKILSSVDGPFNLSKVVRGLIIYGLDTHYLYGLIDAIRKTTPERLHELANKYFSEEDLYEVVIG